MVAKYQAFLHGSSSAQQSVDENKIILVNPIIEYIDDEDASDKEISIDEVKARIARDELLLKHLEDKQKHGKHINNAMTANSAYNRKKKFVRSMAIILRHMLKITTECDVQGFVYGVVPNSGKTLCGASDNLRDWWQKKVRFDRNGLLAIAKYNAEIQIPGPNNPIKPATVSPRSLLGIQDSTLGSILSELMLHCNPPQRKYPLGRGICPPWWPKGNEEWWNELGFSNGLKRIPYRKPRDLKKVMKVGVLISIVKHVAPKTDELCMIVRMSRGLQDKMTAKEIHTWLAVVKQEEENYFEAHKDMIQHGASSGRMIYEDTIELNDEGSQECCDTYDEENKKKKNGETSVKRIARVDDEAVKKGIHLCENEGCRHSDYRFGYLEKVGRDHHMEFECKYKKNLSAVDEAKDVNDTSTDWINADISLKQKEPIEKLMNGYDIHGNVMNTEEVKENEFLQPSDEDFLEMISDLVRDDFVVPMEFIYPIEPTETQTEQQQMEIENQSVHQLQQMDMDTIQRMKQQQRDLNATETMHRRRKFVETNQTMLQQQQQMDMDTAQRMKQQQQQPMETNQRMLHTKQQQQQFVETNQSMRHRQQQIDMGTAQRMKQQQQFGEMNQRMLHQQQQMDMETAQRMKQQQQQRFMERNQRMVHQQQEQMEMNRKMQQRPNQMQPYPDAGYNRLQYNTNYMDMQHFQDSGYNFEFGTPPHVNNLVMPMEKNQAQFGDQGYLNNVACNGSEETLVPDENEL